MSLDRLGSLDGSLRPLRDWPFKCSARGSREVALWVFAKRAEADGWIEGWTNAVFRDGLGRNKIKAGDG